MSDYSPRPLRVLLVEDNPGDANLIEKRLRDADTTLLAASYDLTHVEALPDALDRLEAGGVDVVLLDLGLPGSRGIETLERALPAADGVPVVVLTGLENQETAVRAIQKGAQDYLRKGAIDGEVLVRSLRYAVERAENQRKLELQNRRLEAFASVISHDIRNPLSIATGNVDVAREEGPEEREAALEAAADALDRMDGLVEDLLSLARQGQAIDDPEPTSVAAVASRAWTQVATDDAALQVTYPGETTVLADEARLCELFENLYRNAVEHGGADVTVRVGAFDDGRGCYVADDGPGIPEDERDSVFERGFTTDEEGTGLGLAIVETIAEAHGWSVAVTTSETEGTRVEVTGLRPVDDHEAAA
ncbi:MAG: ATP-binding protein [Halobacteriaceae archaeon]